ncbi:MAG: hypothetical protein WCS96_03635 [Victivallales bacterium]|jgi:hypothetical protein
MKKMTLMLAALFCGAWLVSAQAENKKNAPELKPLDNWTFFQIGFFPGIPSGTGNSNVYGLKLGAPMVDGYGRVYGIEPSLLYSGTDYVNGIQATWVGPSICKETYGIQAAWFGPTIAKKVYGLQASCAVNVLDDIMGFQPGAVNIAKNVCGFQASVVNVAEKVTGLQASAVNVTKEITGLQFGAVNYSRKNGCQIGAINIIEDGWIPFTLLFNIKY